MLFLRLLMGLLGLVGTGQSFHLSHLGLPVTQLQVSPSAVFVSSPKALGQLSLSASTPSLVWRFVEPLEHNCSIRVSSLTAPEGVSVHGLVSLSECNTPKGYHRLDLRSASTGSLKWSKILPSKDAQEKQQVLYSLDALDPHHGYFLIGSTLYKVHLKDGALSWSFVSSTTKIWESLEFHEGMVYLIGRTQSQSQEITVTMIDSMTGTKDTTGSYSLTNYDTIGSLFTIKTLAKGEAPALHLVSTLLSGTTQIHPIGGKRNGWTTMPNTRNANSVPSGLHTFSGFIASSSSSDSDSQQKVVKVKYSGKKYDFETLVDFEQTSTASFYAATRVKGEFIGLAHLEPAIDKKQLKVTLLDLSLKKPVKKSYTIQWDSSSLATIERASLGGSFTTPTLVILTTDGMVHFIQKEGVIGSRDESLSEIVDDVFVPLHQSLDDATAKDKFALKNFGWIQNPYLAIEELSKKVSWALISLFSNTQDTTTTTSHTNSLAFHQYWVVATKRDTLVALDTNSGKTVWRVYVPGARWTSLSLSSHTSSESLSTQPPLLVAYGKLSIQVNALTGEYRLVKKKASMDALFAVTLPSSVTKNETAVSVSVCVGKDLRVSVDPINSRDGVNEFEKRPFYFYTGANVGSKGLKGFVVNGKVGKDMKYGSVPTWTFDLPPGESFVAFAPHEKDETVASIGRVLGDRSVMYKYLNPNLLAFITEATSGSSKALYMYLLDTVSGSLLYRSIHPGAMKVSDSLSIQVLQCENFVVYTYWSDGPGAGTEFMDELNPILEARPSYKKAKDYQTEVPDAKGVEVVVLELFEHSKADRRVAGTEFSSFTANKPHIVSQAYVLSQSVTAMGVTRTKAGITTREILFGLSSGQLYGINKRFLDPRRPLGKPTSEDQEEGLVPYKAALELNPKSSASRKDYVAGIKKIVSSPTFLESTSLVIAYGFDVYQTLRRPSQAFDVLKEDLNHVALLGTMGGLVAAIYAVQHLSDKKRLNDAWKFRMQVHCYQFNRSIFVDMTGATVYEPVPLAKWVATQPVTTDTTSLSTNRAGETPLASLSPSEMTLVLCYGPYLDVYNGRRLSLKLKLEGSISSVSWSLDGRFILVVLESSLLSLYEVAVDSAGKVVELKACYQATAKENVKAVTFLASENVGDSTDEYFFASLSDKSTLSLWTVNESRLKLSGSFSLDRLVNAASGLLWDSSKSQLVIVGSHPGGSRMSVWRFSKNAPHFTSPTQEVLPPIESGAASLTWNSIVSKIQQVFQRPVLTKTDALASWDLSWNSKYFLAVTSIGQVEIWDCEQPTMVYEASSLTLLSRFLTDKDSEDSLVIRAQFTTKDAHSMLLTFDTGHLALLNFTSEFSLKKVDYASQFYPHVNTAPVLNDRIYVAEKESGLHRAVYRDGSEKLEVAKTRLEESSRSVDLISAVKELALKYLAFSTSALLWQWDQQPQVPETLKAPSDIQECIYQLTCILPLPPREYLERKMHHKEFKDALTIAQKYSLPCDDILEAQFREALESRHLQVDLSVLDQIQDKGRVRDICLNLHNSPEIARQLLTYALHLTDSLTPDKIDEEVEAMLEDSMRRSSTDPGLSVTDRCILRLQCLRSLDRLETYEAIQPNCYEDPRFRESFRAFCQEDLTNVAVGFASEGNTSALHILFTRHGSVTLPYRKHIMSFLPDGLEVSAYKLLLPQNGNGNSESHQWIVAPWRQADWIEDSKYTEFIGLISEEESPSNRLIQEPDSIDWSEWYKRRVTLVEGRSGLVDSALDLANDGISRGIQGLEQMQRKLVALKNMIYSDMSSKLEDFSISTLESLPADDLLRTMILLAEPSLLTKHISNIIVPFLSLLPNPLKTLKGVLAKLSESDLEFITAMVKSPVVAELLEFSSDTDIKHMILDCVYAYQFVDAPTGWQLFVEFLERPIEKAQTSDGWDIEMNEFDELDSPARAVATNALKTRISVFKKHLTAKEILSQYHLNRPFSWFVMSAEAPELQNELFKEILECITRARSPTDSDSSLEKLVKYLLTLHESGILSRMPRKKLLWDTISVILRSGRTKLAERLLFPSQGFPPLPLDEAETLLLNTSKEFFDNADSCDASRGYLSIAKKCLRMIPNPSSMVKEELELIDTVASLAKLSGDDTELLPIQVRLEKDRFALIRNALHQNLSIARNLSEVDTVALRLCKGSFSETDILVRVRSVTVSLLLDRDEPSRALKLALETCAKVTESKLDPESATLSEFLLHVMQLVKSPKVSDIAGKCALLNGALVFCPSGELDTILELFETIDMESLSEDSTLVFDPSEADLIMKSLLDQSLALKTGSNSPPQTLSHTRAQDPFVFRNTNTETLSKKQRKLQLLEDCLSCHNGTDNLKLWDQAILEIATLVHSDTPYLSSGYLLNLSDINLSRSFFDLLHPSTRNESLTSYFWMLQSLRSKRSDSRTNTESAPERLSSYSTGKINRTLNPDKKGHKLKPAPKSPIKDKIVPTSNIVSNVPSIDLNKASIQEIRWSKETISIEEDESLKQNVQLSPPEASVPSLVKPEVQGSLKELDGWEQDDLTDLVDIAPTVSTSSDVCADEDIPSDGTPSGLNDAQDIPSLAILATEAAWDDFGLEELQSPEVPSIVESPPTVAEESVAHPDFMNLAHKYSEDMKSKREELKLKTFAESHSLDFQTFMEDPSYREAAILQSGETLNRDTILLGSGVAEYYGTLSKFNYSHLVWVFTTDLAVDAMSFHVAEMGYIDSDPGHICDAILKVHGRPSCKETGKIMSLYEILCQVPHEVLEQTYGREARSQITRRIEFLRRFGAVFPAKESGFIELLEMSDSSRDVLASYLSQKLHTLMSFDIAKFIDGLFALGKIFPTEKPFNFGSIDVEFIRSSVVCQVLKGRCMTVGHVDSQSAASFFDELSSAYQFLYPEHNLSLVHHLFDVSKLAIERRCTVAEDAQLHMPPDSQEFEVLAPLLSHLSLLVKLQSLTDEVSGDSLDSEIIDAFANSHSSGYIEALKTAVSMAVSPSLVIQTYARLLEHLSESFPALEDIYAAILRQKMADGSIDDLERIIRSVVECVVMNDGQLDEDGWGMDVLEENVSELQTAIDLIETKMKKELLDFTSATGSFDVHVVDYVKGLLNNYFALENSEFSIVENPSGSKSYGLWDIDENELATLDHGQVVQTLVPLTQNQKQVRYIVSLSLQNAQNGLATTYVSLLCYKIAELREFDLLLSYRIGLPSEIVIDGESESNLLLALEPYGLEFVKNAIISSNLSVKVQGIERLIKLLQENIMELAEDRALHLVLCSQRLSSQFVNSTLWPHILNTLDVLAEENAEASQELLDFVTSDLLQNHCYAAAATMSMKTWKVPTEFSSGIFSWIGSMNQSSSTSAQLAGVSRKSLATLLDLALSIK